MTARQEERGIADPPQSVDCPIFSLEQEPAELWGAMRGTVTVAPAADLTEATREKFGKPKRDQRAARVFRSRAPLESSIS